jgi:hypothetical protein
MRLNGQSINKGRLEVYKNRTWSPVCSPTWNSTLTDVICHRLGFSVNNSIVNNGFDSLSFLNKVSCSERQSNMSSCEETGPSITGNCNHSKYVDVACKGWLVFSLMFLIEMIIIDLTLLEFITTRPPQSSSQSSSSQSSYLNIFIKVNSYFCILAKYLSEIATLT